MVLASPCSHALFSLVVEMLSEAVKLLKVRYLVKAIDAHKMDQAIIFCRTKLDCDNAENYLLSLGGGQSVCPCDSLLVSQTSLSGT